MILKQNKGSAEVWESFSWLPTNQTEPYRDATYSRPDFALELIDCWRGLEKGMQRGWVCYAGSDYMWGEIDVDEYRHYDNPANGDTDQERDQGRREFPDRHGIHRHGADFRRPCAVISRHERRAADCGV